MTSCPNAALVSARLTEVERTLQLCPEFEQFFGRTHLQKWIPNQPDLVEHMLEGVKLAGFRILEEPDVRGN